MPLSADDLAGVIADAIKAANAPLLSRIAVLEAKGFPAAIVGERGAPGEDGKDAPPVTREQIAESIMAMPDVIERAVSDYVSAHPPKDGVNGIDGKDAEVDLDALAVKAAELIPMPKDGKDGLDGLDGKDGTHGKDGQDAVDVDLDALALKAAELIPTPKDGTDGLNGKDGVNGRDAEPVDLDALALKAAELIPTPKDGASVTVEDIAPLVADVVAKAVAEIPAAKDGAPGAPGESVDPAVVKTMVAEAVATIPIPKDGQSVTVEDVAPLVASEVEKAVRALPVPKDGVGVAGALISKDGLLVLTLSDGSLHELGHIVGRDGEKGEKGDPGIAINGKDGRDGKLENLKAVFDGERTVALCFKDTGEPIEGGVFKFVGMTIYRGIWTADRAYETGDQVTRDGSQWTAKADSIGKQPGTNEGGAFWQMSAKRGNDGKAGPQGPQGLQGGRGEKGDPGRHGGYN